MKSDRKTGIPMKRSKVIVHMYVSIDGKIDGEYGSSISSQYYSDELFELSNADVMLMVVKLFKCMPRQLMHRLI